MAEGRLSHIGIGKETTWGTPATASDYVRFVSESITENTEDLRQEVIRATRDAPDSLQGQIEVAGDIELEVYPGTIGYFLRSLLGAPTTTQPDGVNDPNTYQHVFTPSDTPFSDDCANPPYTLEIYRDLDNADQYAGCVANELSFNFGVGQKILRATASILGKTRADLAATSPSFTDEDAFTWNQASITIGGSANNNLEELTINIANGLEPVFLLDGARTPAKILPSGFREFTFSGTFGVVDDHTEYDKYIGWTTQDWIITFEGATIDTNYKYTLKFTLKDCLYTTWPIGVSGPNRLTVGFEARAQRNATAGYTCEVTLINTQTAY